MELECRLWHGANINLLQIMNYATQNISNSLTAKFIKEGGL